MNYTWDKYVPGSNLSQSRSPDEASGNNEGGPAVPLCLHPWGFGHCMSGSPGLSCPWGWECLFIQASPACATGSHPDPWISPMALCEETMARHFSLRPPQPIPAGPS